MKAEKFMKLILIVTMTVLALGGVGYGLLTNEAAATTSAPDYDIVFSPQDAPLAGRAAPYGQFIVTHNGVSITSTQALGTVARTNGYDKFKTIFCDVGVYTVTAQLFGRTTSTGGVYTITNAAWTFIPNTRSITTTNMEHTSPWMSLGLTSEVTGSTTTCGLYVFTP